MNEYPNEEFWGSEVMSEHYTITPDLLLRVNIYLPKAERLKPIDTLVLIHLITHAHKITETSTVFPTQETLASYIGCSRNTIRESIDRLKVGGWIVEKQYKHYHRWEYDLKPTRDRLKAIVGKFSGEEVKCEEDTIDQAESNTEDAYNDFDADF